MLLNVDGSENQHGKVTEEVALNTRVDGWEGRINFLIANLNDSEAILGADWLFATNPQIDWRDQSLQFNNSGKIRTIKGNPLIPLHYQEFADVFSEEKAARFPLKKPWDLSIDLEIPPEEYTSKIGRGGIYAMNREERKELDEWVKDNLKKGYIRPSRSPISAPVFFIGKKDGKKRLVQNYKKINQYTRKDAYPLPIMKVLADRVEGSRIFTALDLRWGYHNVRIKEGDEWKAAFTTPMGLFEPLVMLFGLTNSPSAFQRMMDDILRGTEHFTVVYLDDILIYSQNLEEHRVHVKEVLQRLKDNDLFCKPEKCVFETDCLEYLGTWIEKGTLRMDKDKLEAIENWPIPRKVKDVRSFLGFANFYRHFITGFSHWSKTLTRLTKKNQKWEWGDEEQKAFDKLKDAFMTAPVLILPDYNKQFILETDASDFATGAVLSQEGEDGKIHPVAYYSAKMDPSELNYEIFDKEMLAIINALKKWRHHLMGTLLPVKIYSDHKNLTYFKHPNDLSPRQARWFARLLHYNIELHHQSAERSARTDAFSRNPDWKPKEPRNKGMILINPKWDHSPHIRQITIDPLNQEIINNTSYDPEVVKALETLRNTKDPASLKETLSTWTVHEGIILYQGRIYVPQNDEIKRRLLERHHDALGAGHPGREKTLELLSRNYWWPSMTTFTHQYVDGCIECQQNKIFPRRTQNLMGRHEIPDKPWNIISVDLITDLPLSEGADSILTIVDYHSKQGHFIPTNKNLDSEGLMKLYLKNVWKIHGTPSKIVSDRGPQFASEFTKALQKGLNIETALSTAHHPETDGQTERLNQTVETFLRIYSNHHQDNWAELLPMAEFAYNSQKHSATGISPFFALYGYDPTFEINSNPANKVPATQTRLKMMEDLRNEIVASLQRTQDLMTQRNNKEANYKPYQKGMKVWLEATNIRTTAPTKKLAPKRLGPFTIIEQIGNHAYKLKLPPGMSDVHPVFHETLLKPFNTDIIPGRTQEPPSPIEIIEGGNRYEVEEILNSRKKGKGVQYLVKWKGYGSNENTWEPSRNIDDSTQALHVFHQKFPNKPKARINQTRPFDSRKGVMSQTQPSPEAIRRLAYEISDMKASNVLRVKLLSPKATLPVKGTTLAAGYDLSSAQQLTIPVNGRALSRLKRATYC